MVRLCQRCEISLRGHIACKFVQAEIWRQGDIAVSVQWDERRFICRRSRHKAASQKMYSPKRLSQFAVGKERKRAKP